MSKTFQNSFAKGQVKEGQRSGGNTRPSIPSGSHLDDVLQHYVRPSVQVMSTGQRSANGHAIPGSGELDANLFKTISDRRDIKNILSMNPNAELAIEIVVNGTLSPNNTLDSSLQYKSSYDKLGVLKSKLLQKIQFIMNEYTELEDKLPTILRDAKYDVGSYALLVIPLGNVKKFIDEDRLNKQHNNNYGPTVQLENFFNSLNDPKKFERLKSGFNSKYIPPIKAAISLEQIGFKADEFTDKKIPDVSGIMIHSDLDVLRAGYVCEAAMKMESENDVLSQLDGLSSYDPTEDLKSMKQENLSDVIIDKSLDRARNFSLDDVLHITPSEDYESNDLPICKHIPHESIFVVHKPGSPEQHEGYFIVMDMTGNPVSVDDELDVYMPTYSGQYGNTATQSAMSGASNFAGGNSELGYSGYGMQGMSAKRLSDKSALFTKLMDDKIRGLLSSGYFKTRDLTLAKKTELMELMFSRLCSNKQTQMVFVPSSLMTYVAFDYDDAGNGQSLVIKHKNIGVLNSILTLANTLAAVNNTIDYKKIHVQFDDDEIDFNKVVEGIAGNLSRYTTLNATRFLNTDANTQIDFLGHHGYQWEFADHPHFPSTQVSIENLDRERTVPDSDTVEKNENLLIQALGSTPEVVDMARNVEYASSYFQSNLQAARRAIADQRVLTKFLNKFIHTYVLNAPIVLKWLIQEVDKTRGENYELRGIKTIDIVRNFVKSITVHLPKPDMVKVELLDNAIQAQEKLVDNVLKYTIGEEVLEGADVGDNLEEALDGIRRKLKGLIMRDWMASNNMLNDVFIRGLYAGDREEVDGVVERIEDQQRFLLEILKKHKIITSKDIQKANEEVDKINEAQNLDGSGGSSGSNDFESSNDDSSDNDTSDTGGDDPFGDGGMDESSVESSTDNDDPFA